MLRKIGWTLLAVGCAQAPEPVLRQPPLAAAARSATPIDPPPVEVAPKVELALPAASEVALGVIDRGVYADLDARIQLPPPGSKSKLTGLVDVRRGLLVIYADGFPHKVYPLGAGASFELGGERLSLRPGDRAELAQHRIEVRKLTAGEIAIAVITSGRAPQPRGQG